MNAADARLTLDRALIAKQDATADIRLSPDGVDTTLALHFGTLWDVFGPTDFAAGFAEMLRLFQVLDQT